MSRQYLLSSHNNNNHHHAFIYIYNFDCRVKEETDLYKLMDLRNPSIVPPELSVDARKQMYVLFFLFDTSNSFYY